VNLEPIESLPKLGLLVGSIQLLVLTQAAVVERGPET
jgi:hypothetical protein